MKHLLLIASLLIFAFDLRSQTSPDTLLWSWLTEGFMKDPYKSLDAGRMDSIRAAMSAIRRTNTVSDALAVGYYLLANEFILQKDVYSSDTCLEQGIKAAIEPGVKGALYQMDEIFASSILYDAARSRYSGEQAIRFYSMAGEWAQVLTSYSNLVFASLQYNMCSRGIQQLNHALSYYESIKEKLSQLEADYYKNEIAPHHTFLKARCKVCLADSLRIWGNEKQAKNNYKDAKMVLDAMKKSGLRSWSRGTVYLNLAAAKHRTEVPISEVMTDLDSATVAFTAGNFNLTISTLKGYRAYINIFAGQYGDTTQLLEAMSHLSGKNTTTLFVRTDKKWLMQSKDLNNLYHLFLYKAEVAELLSEKTGKPAYLRQAYQDYRTIMDIVEIQRLVVTEDEALYSISHRYAHVMRKGVKILFQLHQMAQSSASKEQYQEQMWEIVQKSKEYTLRQAIRKNNFIIFSPDLQVIAREDSLYLAKLRETYRAYRLASGEKSLSLFEVYNKEKKRYDDWIHSLPRRGEPFKRYYQERYQDEYITVKQAQKMLKPDQTLIEYFFIDRHQLLVFVYSNELSHVQLLILDDFLYAELRQLDAALTTPGSDFHIQVKNLYDLLIKPVKSQLQTKRLLICPDKLLSDLPFDILTDTMPADIKDYSKYPYLIKKYAIGYDYSAFTHYKCMNAPKKTYSFDFISFAPYWKILSEELIETLSNEQKTLARKLLKRSKEEVDIAGRLRGNARHQPFLDREATLDTFYRYASLARILHVSSHAIFDGKQPGNSFILFYPNGTDGSSLSLRDVYNMKIPSEMVVLSACETLKGNWKEGEGMFTWGKAFSHSGALSVFASRWNAHEETSIGMVELFYKNLPDQSKDVALQKAKEKYKNKHPHFWANFTVIGNQNAIQP